MSADWYPGIKAFCAHWPNAPELQRTLASLESEFAGDRDGSIDAAKALVECACRLLIEELDDPTNPQKPKKSNIPLGELLGVVMPLLDFGKAGDRAFANLISEYHRVADALRMLRNETGTLSHGRDCFIEKLSVHRRRGAILAADAIVAFLHEAYLEKGPDIIRTLGPYERLSVGNTLIDDSTRVVAAIAGANSLHVKILLPNGEEIPFEILPSRLLFELDRLAYKQTLNACAEVAASRDKEAA